MRILAVDPNPADLGQLVDCLSAIRPDDDIISYADPMLAFQYAFHHAVDEIFTAVNMKRLDGFGLVKMLRGDHPAGLFFFVAEDDAYRRDAERLAVDGYILKPVTAVAVRKAREEAAREEI